MILKHSKDIEIRFSEIDSMGVVWHGSYTLYFEDAREAFGQKYGLGYMTFFESYPPNFCIINPPVIGANNAVKTIIIMK